MSKKFFLFIVLIFLICNLFAATKNNIKEVISFVVVMVSVVSFIFVICYFISTMNCCSGYIPFKIGEKLELQVGNGFLSDCYLLKLEIQEIVKNRFTVFCQVSSKSTDETKPIIEVENVKITGSKKSETEICVAKDQSIPLLISMTYNKKKNAVEISAQKKIDPSTTVPQTDW